MNLSQRLARALDLGEATIAQRSTVVAAAQNAQTFHDLPPHVQTLVLELERVAGQQR